MAGTFDTSGGNTTVTFKYTGSAAVIQSIVGDAAAYLWNETVDDEGVVVNPFSGATNQEKLNLVDKHIKQVIVDLANTHKSRKAQEEARKAEALAEYQL